jgi:hypothetical protein
VTATIEIPKRAPEQLIAPRESDVIFTEAKLKGSCIVDAECRGDERGFLARIFYSKE